MRKAIKNMQSKNEKKAQDQMSSITNDLKRLMEMYIELNEIDAEVEITQDRWSKRYVVRIKGQYNPFITVEMDRNRSSYRTPYTGNVRLFLMSAYKTVRHSARKKWDDDGLMNYVNRFFDELRWELQSQEQQKIDEQRIEMNASPSCKQDSKSPTSTILTDSDHHASARTV